MKQFTVVFSPYRPLIVDQLKEQGLKFIRDEHARKFQRLADHCTNLRISGVLTESEADKVNRRIVKEMSKAVIDL